MDIRRAPSVKLVGDKKSPTYDFQTEISDEKKFTVCRKNKCHLQFVVSYIYFIILYC